VWLACVDCGEPRFTCAKRPRPRCQTCSGKKQRREFDLNEAPHRDDCKCYRCRIGKGYFVGPNNPAWQGGKQKAAGGYVAAWVSPNDPMHVMTWSQDGRKNHCLEHRLVMARHLGRPLTEDEYVHHKNGVRDDNRIENLELWARPHPAGVRASDQEAQDE